MRGVGPQPSPFYPAACSSAVLSSIGEFFPDGEQASSTEAAWGKLTSRWMQRYRVLGLEVASKGYSFAVLEGPERLIDWGSRAVAGDTSAYVARLTPVLRRYRPDLVAMEDAAGSRKSERVRDYIAWTEELCHREMIPTVAISREAWLAYVEGYGPTKHELAVALARLFPELQSKVPRKRRAWESETRRMAVFVALGRALYVAERQDIE